MILREFTHLFDDRKGFRESSSSWIPISLYLKPLNQIFIHFQPSNLTFTNIYISINKQLPYLNCLPNFLWVDA